VYGPSDRVGITSGRLECRGPFGDKNVATSNRAELRAIIGALRLCNWKAQGFDSIVIATSSSYAVDGATSWAKGCVRRGWKKSSTGERVKNRDLWELFLGEVEKSKDVGLHVSLWQIPRELNSRADAAAKKAASPDSAELVEFSDVRLFSPRQQTSPRVLFLCFDYESIFEDVFAHLTAQIGSKAKMERATTHVDAMTKLGTLEQGQPPFVIFIADGSLTRHREVWERVINILHKGATVVLAGCFSSMVSAGQFDRFFARLGLPWERGSYHRMTVSLRPSAVDVQLRSRLPTSYSQKAVFVKNVPPSAAWYAESASSGEVAVAFTQVGRGKLGYMGDANGEVESEAVVLAMCGLLG
jgi:ribonuclease HI